MAKHRKPKPANDPCAYCGVRMVKLRGRPGLVSPQNQYTIDHIIPQHQCERHDVSHPFNKVPACFKCNQDKGPRSPMKWLAIMPEYGVEAFIERCRVLGFGNGCIKTAMENRKKWLQSLNVKDNCASVTATTSCSSLPAV